MTTHETIAAHVSTAAGSRQALKLPLNLHERAQATGLNITVASSIVHPGY